MGGKAGASRQRFSHDCRPGCDGERGGEGLFFLIVLQARKDRMDGGLANAAIGSQPKKTKAVADQKRGGTRTNNNEARAGRGRQLCAPTNPAGVAGTLASIASPGTGSLGAVSAACICSDWAWACNAARWARGLLMSFAASA